jgi:hypothetical protein
MGHSFDINNIEDEMESSLLLYETGDASSDLKIPVSFGHSFEINFSTKPIKVSLPDKSELISREVTMVKSIKKNKKGCQKTF